MEQLKQRSLDADPHLPIALGAALEVQSQVLAARGQRTQAARLLQAALRTYANTSIHDRLQKNLNLLSLQGKPAPALRSEESLGAKLPLPAQLKGSPVLLFFWAHWCADCKAEAPIITQLRSEFSGKGLQVIGPTRRYGYTAQIEHASASDELRYIDAVRHRFYADCSTCRCRSANTTSTLTERRRRLRWCCWIARGRWRCIIRGRCLMTSCGRRLRRWWRVRVRPENTPKVHLYGTFAWSVWCQSDVLLDPPDGSMSRSAGTWLYLCGRHNASDARCAAILTSPLLATLGIVRRLHAVRALPNWLQTAVCHVERSSPVLFDHNRMMRQVTITVLYLFGVVVFLGLQTVGQTALERIEVG